jgi:hypothetical protein
MWSPYSPPVHYYAARDDEGQAHELFRRPEGGGDLERWRPRSGEWERLETDRELAFLEYVHASDFTRVRTQVLRAWYSSPQSIGPVDRPRRLDQQADSVPQQGCRPVTE